MQEQIESWIGAVRPWVENEYGSLPEFAVKPGRIINEIPWRIDPDYRKKEWVFRYYSKWFKNEWSKDFPDRDGYLVYAVVHDLIHFYQMEPALKRFNYMRRLPKIIALFATLRFMDWAEGSAELCSRKVLFDRLESDIKTDPPATDTLIDMLQTDGYKKPLSDFLKYVLARDIRELHGTGLINSLNLGSLELPYPIPQSIENTLAQDLLGSSNDKPRKPDNHTTGLLRCARIISQTGISLEELLRTPLTNGQLRQEAGI